MLNNKPNAYVINNMQVVQLLNFLPMQIINYWSKIFLKLEILY
jgi:hypothetical protein